MKDHPYWHPRYVSRHAVFVGSAVTLNATAGTERVRFQFFTDSNLEGVIVRVNTAGTTSGNAFTVKKGTDSIGVVGTITNTANQIATLSFSTPVSFSPTDTLVLANAASDATGKYDIWLIYSEAYG